MTTNTATVSSSNLSSSNYTNTTTTTATTATINYNGNYVTSVSTPTWQYDYNNITNIGSYSSQDYIKDLVDQYFKEEKTKKEKENKSMNIDFSFGPYNTDAIRLSLYGMAVKNEANKWVSYDHKTGRLMDVEVFNIPVESKKVFYKLPKAVNNVVPGDIILHNGKPVFVEVVREDGKFEVIDPSEGTAVVILPTVSPFGFNFVTQIISLADYMPKATENNPFGNLLPFVLAGNDSNGLMMAMLLGQDINDLDPMMLMLLCGGKSDISTMLMMQMLKKQSGPTEVKP